MTAEPQPSESSETQAADFLRAATSFLQAASGVAVPAITLRNRALSETLTAAPVQREKIILPDLADPEKTPVLAAARAAADSAAAWLTHNDADIHKKFRPAGENAAAVYDLLAKARCDTLLARDFPGAGVNIGAAMEQYARSADQHSPNQMRTAAYMMAWEALGGASLPPDVLAFLDAQRNAVDNAMTGRREKLANGLSRLFGGKAGAMPDKMQELKPHLQDQAEFSSRAAVLAKKLGALIGRDQKEKKPGNSEEETAEDGEEEKQAGGKLDERENPATKNEPASLSHGAGLSACPDIIDKDYRIYTREFDQIVGAADLVAPQYKIALRQDMDNALQPYQHVVNTLAARLQRKLMAQQRRSWDFDREDGQLDPARLARIVTDPLQPLSFRQDRPAPFMETVVAILVDNSFSMTGPKIHAAALTADILSRTLERAGVKNEILGFTTGREDLGLQRWKRNGEKPADPGRIDDLLHIVYKSAAQSWRRAKDDIAVMLKPEILWHNMDGEALIWAFNRLAARPEPRKILLVISDGAPAGETPAGKTPRHFLENHLRSVTAYIESETDVELIAIGIGTNVGRFYKNAVRIDHGEELATALIGKLDALFSSSTDRPRRGAGAAPS